VPYIKQEERKVKASIAIPDSPGNLNYNISLLLDHYLRQRGGVNYTNINEVVGVLECAKLELYRRVAAPYEQEKMRLNGDVYTCQIAAKSGD